MQPSAATSGHTTIQTASGGVGAGTPPTLWGRFKALGLLGPLLAAQAAVSAASLALGFGTLLTCVGFFFQLNRGYLLASCLTALFFLSIALLGALCIVLFIQRRPAFIKVHRAQLLCAAVLGAASRLASSMAEPYGGPLLLWLLALYLVPGMLAHAYYLRSPLLHARLGGTPNIQAPVPGLLHAPGHMGGVLPLLLVLQWAGCLVTLALGGYIAKNLLLFVRHGSSLADILTMLVFVLALLGWLYVKVRTLFMLQRRDTGFLRFYHFGCIFGVLAATASVLAVLRILAFSPFDFVADYLTHYPTQRRTLSLAPEMAALLFLVVLVPLLTAVLLSIFYTKSLWLRSYMGGTLYLYKSPFTREAAYPGFAKAALPKRPRATTRQRGVVAALCLALPAAALAAAVLFAQYGYILPYQNDANPAQSTVGLTMRLNEIARETGAPVQASAAQGVIVLTCEDGAVAALAYGATRCTIYPAGQAFTTGHLPGIAAALAGAGIAPTYADAHAAAFSLLQQYDGENHTSLQAGDYTLLLYRQTGSFNTRDILLIAHARDLDKTPVFAAFGLA